MMARPASTSSVSELPGSETPAKDDTTSVYAALPRTARYSATRSPGSDRLSMAEPSSLPSCPVAGRGSVPESETLEAVATSRSSRCSRLRSVARCRGLPPVERCRAPSSRGSGGAPQKRETNSTMPSSESPNSRTSRLESSRARRDHASEWGPAGGNRPVSTRATGTCRVAERSSSRAATFSIVAIVWRVAQWRSSTATTIPCPTEARSTTSSRW